MCLGMRWLQGVGASSRGLPQPDAAAGWPQTCTAGRFLRPPLPVPGLANSSGTTACKHCTSLPGSWCRVSGTCVWTSASVLSSLRLLAMDQEGEGARLQLEEESHSNPRSSKQFKSWLVDAVHGGMAVAAVRSQGPHGPWLLLAAVAMCDMGGKGDNM